MSKLKWNIPVELEIEYSHVIGYIQENCIQNMEDGNIIEDYNEKTLFICDAITDLLVYYEDTMELYKAFQYDGYIDIYELKSTNDQLLDVLYEFFSKIIEEED